MNNLSIQKDQDNDAYQRRMPNLARRIEKVRKASASRLRKSWDDLLNSVGYDGTDRTFLDLPIPPAQKKAIKEKAKSVPRVTDTILKRMLGVYTARKALQDLGRIEASKGAEEMQEAMRPTIIKTVEEAHSRANFGIAREVGITDTYEPPSETYVERIANKHTPYTLAHSYTLRAMSEPMYKTLMQGIQAGKNPNEIGRQLAKQQEDLLPYRAKMIARTLITEASADTEAQALKDAGFDEYCFMAGLDEKTCEVCGHLDGQVFKLDERERGKNCPPMHLNCRCTVTCVISEKYRKDTETRSARSTKGKWTKVPATMTYDEWKAQNEDRLKEMRKSKKRRKTAPKPKTESRPKPDPEKVRPETPRAESFGNWKEQLPEDMVDHALDDLNVAPQIMNEVWANYSNGLKINQSLGKPRRGSFYNPEYGVIYLNQEALERPKKYDWYNPETKQIESREFSTLTSTLWHESGHHLADILAKKSGLIGEKYVDDIASMYRSTKQIKTNEDGTQEGYTLSELVIVEAKEYRQGIIGRLKAEQKRNSLAYADKYGHKTFEIADANLELGNEFKRIPPPGSGDVSDIFNGAFEGAVKGSMGHPTSYWKRDPKRRLPGQEAFAEMTSATMSNNSSLKQIKIYFPRSYNLYLEILEESKKWT